MNQRPLLIIGILLWWIVSLTSMSAAELRGKVVRVADGDTVTVLVDRQQHKVRLDGIDAPEIGQAFGNKSKQALSGLVAGKQVMVKVGGKDRYERVLGVIFVGDTNVNEWMVRHGWAWQYTKYNRSKSLAGLQADARERKLGLWAEDGSIPPWDYRANQRRRARVASGDEAITGYWLNTSSNTRHNSTCEWYKNTSKGRACGKDEGKACGGCGG